MAAAAAAAAVAANPETITSLVTKLCGPDYFGLFPGMTPKPVSANDLAAHVEAFEKRLDTVVPPALLELWSACGGFGSDDDFIVFGSEEALKQEQKNGDYPDDEWDNMDPDEEEEAWVKLEAEMYQTSKIYFASLNQGRDWGLIFLCNDDKSRYYNQVLVRDNSGNRNMEMDLLTFLTKIVTTFDGARAEANPIGNKLDLCDLHFYDLLR